MPEDDDDEMLEQLIRLIEPSISEHVRLKSESAKITEMERPTAWVVVQRDEKMIDRAIANYLARVESGRTVDEPVGSPDRDRTCVIDLGGLLHVLVISTAGDNIALYRIRGKGRLQWLPLYRAIPVRRDVLVRGKKHARRKGFLLH